jgi:hypothetical protein
MSDDLLRWIPVEPTFVPAEDAAMRAVEWLRARAPGADEVTSRVTEEIELVDCGGNLERIECPRCGAELDVEWWGEAMATAAEMSFRDRSVEMPCCDETVDLAALRYEAPQGFARFVLEARNAGIGMPTAEDAAQLGRLLGTDVRLIRSHE